MEHGGLIEGTPTHAPAPTTPGSLDDHKTRVIRVFLCDDVPEFRALMRLALEDDPLLDVVGEAGDGDACLDGVLRTRADVVLLDLAMPHRDGLVSIPRLRKELPTLRIIVLSGFSEERMGAQVREAGAHGYVEKGESFATICRAVRESVEAGSGDDAR
jgi:DNA-binding NarL/FixJ family response regulator